MNRYALIGFLLLALGASAQDAGTTQPAPGYIITPRGELIFPDAPPPTGDTSTLSGAGPNVSTGPEVGPGPEVSAGPVVGPPDVAQHAATLEALDALRQAEALLAGGNSDGVDDQLSRAEAALSGRTRLDVEAAREALARSDLYPARQYLAAALAERRALMAATPALPAAARR
jgi:hypothetical protein